MLLFAQCHARTIHFCSTFKLIRTFPIQLNIDYGILWTHAEILNISVSTVRLLTHESVFEIGVIKQFHGGDVRKCRSPQAFTRATVFLFRTRAV